MAFSLTPPYAEAPEVRVSYNLGGTLDVCTGKFLRGRHGEYVLNGGQGATTGIVGVGNSMKSTAQAAMMFTPMSHIPESQGNIYDTEFHVNKGRLGEISANIEGFHGEDILETGRVTVSSKSEYHANEWYEVFKDYNKSKIANAKSLLRTTPFVNWRKHEMLKVLVPTPHAIDSFSEFESEDVANMQEANELGDSGANMLHMRGGASKVRFLTDVPKYVHQGSSPLLLTAHLGETFNLDPRNPKNKTLQYLPANMTIKGVGSKFVFMTTNCWWAKNAAPLINDTTKAPEFPRDVHDAAKMETDLVNVTFTCLRNKNGPSGFSLQLLFSQKEGFLPSLTEFFYLKTYKRFGFEGNDQNYRILLCPDIALSRTTVRSKIKKHPELRRALNLLSEIVQMTVMQRVEHEEYLLDAQQLYDKIKAQGYDWPQLLKHTRGWWTFNNDLPFIQDEVPLYFLSTKDFLNMARGTYHPFWLKPDKKTFLTDKEITALGEAWDKNQTLAGKLKPTEPALETETLEAMA